MADDVTRVEVRKNAIGYVAMTVATSVAVSLGAGILQVFAVAVIAYEATRIAAQAFVTFRSPAYARQRGQEKWTAAAALGGYIGLFLGRVWFPWDAYVGQLLSDGSVEVPANAARTLIVAFGLGMATWIVALMLPLQRYPALARMENLGTKRAGSDIAPGQTGDVALFALALVSVLAPAMSAMDDLTAPFQWPAVQIAVAFLLTLPLIKRRSIEGALMVYRITFATFAVLLVRLALGISPELAILDRAIIGLAFVGVLALSGLGHVRTARLRDVKPSGGLQPGAIP